jgi:hypothetical protein
MVIDRA